MRSVDWTTKEGRIWQNLHLELNIDPHFEFMPAEKRLYFTRKAT
jgi:hypothetical protein